MILDQNWNGTGARGRRLPAISKGESAEMANDWWVPRKVHGDWQQRPKGFLSGAYKYLIIWVSTKTYTQKYITWMQS